jgi:hypothetical protein
VSPAARRFLLYATAIMACNAAMGALLPNAPLAVRACILAVETAFALMTFAYVWLAHDGAGPC